MAKTTTPKDSYLLAFLPNAAFDGWTMEALAATARSLGISLEKMQDIYPKGVEDMVRHFVVWTDAQMQKKAKGKKFESLKVREKIAFCIKTRLDVLAPHKEAVKRLQIHFMQPLNTPLGLKMLAETCDTIWRTCGDMSTDYNFYTKRLLLSGVYTSTIWYWLKDSSPDHKKTWQFLENRIKNVLTLGQLFPFRKKSV